MIPTLCLLTASAYAGHSSVARRRLTDMSISNGADLIFQDAVVNTIEVAALDTTSAIVCYDDSSNSDYGTCSHIKVTGTSLSKGTDLVVSSSAIQAKALKITAISASQAVVCYNDGNSNQGTCNVLSVSGTSLTKGSDAIFNSANTPRMSIAALTATRVVVCYEDAGNSNLLTCIRMMVTGSGTSLSAGTASVVNSAAISAFTLAAFDDNFKAVVCYPDSGNNDYGTCNVLHATDGATLIVGANLVFNSGTTTAVSVKGLASARAAVCYSNNNEGTCRALDRSTTTLSLEGDALVFNSGTTYTQQHYTMC